MSCTIIASVLFVSMSSMCAFEISNSVCSSLSWNPERKTCLPENIPKFLTVHDGSTPRVNGLHEIILNLTVTVALKPFATSA